MKPLPLFA